MRLLPKSLDLTETPLIKAFVLLNNNQTYHSSDPVGPKESGKVEYELQNVVIEGCVGAVQASPSLEICLMVQLEVDQQEPYDIR